MTICRCPPYFNSIKVQLELDYFTGVLPTSQLFQFHKGTIRTFVPPLLALLDLYFNSIKVQLEPISEQSIHCNTEFQFHKGTIRTYFAFHLIPISAYFNSIKVQLELLSKQKSYHSNRLFQFHKGTIRTDCSSEKRSAKTEFQFHKGTIRTCSFAYLRQKCCISIP